MAKAIKSVTTRGTATANTATEKTTVMARARWLAPPGETTIFEIGRETTNPNSAAGKTTINAQVDSKILRFEVKLRNMEICNNLLIRIASQIKAVIIPTGIAVIAFSSNIMNRP